MEEPENPESKQEIESLMLKVKQLEEENQSLYASILKMCSKKNKQSLEYYVRLRKDLMLEQSKLSQKLSEMEAEKNKENLNTKEKFEFLRKKLEELNLENKELKAQIDKNNKNLEEKNDAINRRKVELKNELNEQEIEELENKANNLINALNEKELFAQSQKEQINEIQMKLYNLNEEMSSKINDIKAQYNNVYNANKKNEENFSKLYEDKTNNLKDYIQSNKYQLEKKLVHSKNLINNIENETNILNNVYQADLQRKEMEIINLKKNFDNINNIYNEFSKLCGENNDKIKNNIKQMKEIYNERENEMIEISKTYVNSMNNYEEAIKESENNKNLINSDLTENEILMNKLNERKKKLQEEINELNNQKTEIIGENIENIKNKISSMQTFINNLTEKQKDFSVNIKKVNDFSAFLNKNNNIVKSLEQSIEKNKKKKDNLNDKMTKINLNENDNVENLKNKLKKLEQENAEKDESIKKYEKMFEEVINNMNSQEEIKTDVLKKFNEQIINYKSEIDKLLHSKDSMEEYYKNEIKIIKDTMEFIKAENEQLKKESENLPNESVAQGNINTLCEQEHATFKESYNSIVKIMQNIPEFEKSIGEIKTLRTELLTDELLKTKENIKDKNNEIKILKEAISGNQNNNRSSVKSNKSNTLTKKKTINNNSDLAQILKNIKLKVKIYDSLVNKKMKEVQGLEDHIKLIKDYNTFSRKAGENQELLCEENKIMTDEIINTYSGLNQYEQELKEEAEFLKQKININKDNHENNLQIINDNANLLLNNIKERENYIVKQSEQITDGLKKVANQKKNAVDVLKIENQQLKDRNHLINTKL